MEACKLGQRAPTRAIRPHVAQLPAVARRGVITAAIVQEAAQASSSSGGGFANQLQALKSMSVVVADTGVPELVKKYKPVDCTTNPSLVYKAMQSPDAVPMLRQALEQAASAKMGPAECSAVGARRFSGVADVLSVNLGAEMLKLVPGRVSTEVDAHLSNNTNATVEKALRLLDLYDARGVSPDRVYIKIASTWDGIQACKELQRRGIDCNMTLLFSFAQAAACADVGATLISPFVGRIMDWYKAKEAREFAPHEDPGVASVKRIFSYYKTYGYKTIVMAASFRNVGEIRELAGCDNITISPALLQELEASTDPLPRRLDPSTRDSNDPRAVELDMFSFAALHKPGQMAGDKLLEGIKGFEGDQEKLEEQLAKLAQSCT